MEWSMRRRITVARPTLVHVASLPDGSVAADQRHDHDRQAAAAAGETTP